MPSAAAGLTSQLSSQAASSSQTPLCDAVGDPACRGRREGEGEGEGEGEREGEGEGEGEGERENEGWGGPGKASEMQEERTGEECDPAWEEGEEKRAGEEVMGGAAVELDAMVDQLRYFTPREVRWEGSNRKGGRGEGNDTRDVAASQVTQEKGRTRRTQHCGWSCGL